MATPTFTKTGTKAATPAKLDTAVFGLEVKNHDLLKLAYTAYLANGRIASATTKTRGDVRGGGKKPWRQKGTGRARFGSSRVPQWRHGGVVFGPSGNENYALTIPASAKHTALRQALSLAAQEGKVRVLETFDCKDGKVSETASLLKKIDATGNVLLAVSVKDSLVERATQNLPNVHAVDARYLNAFDIMNADTIVLSQKALEIITTWLATPAKKPAKETK